MLGNVASMHSSSEAQHCVSEMPRNHCHKVEGVGGGGGIALAVRGTLVSQPSIWNIHDAPTHADGPHVPQNICYCKGQIVI